MGRYAVSPHAAKHFARARKRYSLDADYGHHLGYPRESRPVQAWAKASARVSYRDAHKPIPQNAPVKVLPMD